MASVVAKATSPTMSIGIGPSFWYILSNEPFSINFMYMSSSLNEDDFAFSTSTSKPQMVTSLSELSFWIACTSASARSKAKVPSNGID